jgi:hypothetical protein
LCTAEKNKNDEKSIMILMMVATGFFCSGQSYTNIEGDRMLAF